MSQRIPSKGQRIWELVYNQILTENNRSIFDTILTKMKRCENEFFEDRENPLFSWNEKTLEDTFTKYGFKVTGASKTITEKRRLTETEINRWFDRENSSYGAAIYSALGGEDMAKIKNLLLTAKENRLFNWSTTIEFLTVSVVK